MEITEENFVEQMKKRKEKALEYVIDRYGGLIKSIIKKHLYCLKSYQEDCLNEILLAIWNHIDSFDEKRSTFQNWAAGVAKYKAIDFKRKYLKDLKNEDINTIEMKTKNTIDSEILEKELSWEWESLLNCLKEKDKDLFIRLYVEEMKIDEVSEITGIKKEIIYNRVSRGKAKLKQKIPFFLKNGGNRL